MADSQCSKRFAGRRVLICGAAAGHGEHLTRTFHREGAELVLLDINEDVHKLRQALGASAVSFSFDVRDPNAYEKLVASVEGPVDTIVYLPRARIRKPFAELTAADFDEEMNTSLRGALLLTQHFAKRLALRKENFPSVITISSVLSHRVGFETVSYHVAKAGLEQLTRYLAVELGPLGIRMNSVSLGWVIKDAHRERFNSKENTVYRTVAEGSQPLAVTGGAEDLFEAVAFLTSPAAKFITGQVLLVDGGCTLREPSYFYMNVMQKLNQL